MRATSALSREWSCHSQRVHASGLHAGVEVDLVVREGHRHELEHILHDAAEISVPALLAVSCVACACWTRRSFKLTFSFAEDLA